MTKKERERRKAKFADTDLTYITILKSKKKKEEKK